MEQQVNIALSINEVNLVLSGLGKLSETVQQLIPKIASQAQAQVNEAASAPAEGGGNGE